ncbi:MAG: YggS family pyridoxal phosphate-dependent enzyme [Porphyromonas sp.]|nr:YggS family pyridoxal phosphate-dependent enzyme [Porphyromonas sp.]
MNPSLSIGERISAIKQTLPQGVRLVAVSKFHPSEAVVEAYEAGQRVFGESRVQELVTKQEEIGDLYLDLAWHFIGPLQTNKVKYIAPFIQMIESVTSERLLDEINKQAIKHQRKINVLLEVHIAREESKSGFSPEELMELLAHINRQADEYRGIRICGLMAMATNTDDEEIIDQEFALVAQLFQNVKDSGLLLEPDEFDELSMGMSGDYHIALRHGATLVRIGSAIFGHRD